MKRTLLPILLFPGLLLADWPQFIGPGRNGIAGEDTKVIIPSETEDFQRLWKVKVGEGHSSPVVKGDKVLLHHFTGNQETLEALDRTTGKSLWKSGQPAKPGRNYDSNTGPKSTPCIAGDKVYSFGLGGLLTCTALDTGKILWTHDTAGKFRSDNGFFGHCSSPMAANGLVFLNLGGKEGSKGAGIAAFDAETGKLTWHATDHEASYASPILANLQGKSTTVFFTREGLVGATLDPGKAPQTIFDTHYRPQMHASVNAASPVICGENRIFASTCYGVGAGVWEVQADGKLTQTWQKEGLLDCHFATPIYYKGHLYGIHGRQEQGTQIRCIDPATGKQLWTSPRMEHGLPLIADGKLLTLLESGELLIAEATPKGYKELARRQILGTGRAYPAISSGILFARDNSSLAAFKLD